MPRTSAPLPDELGQSFSVKAAFEAGVSERRLRHSRLLSQFYGVRMLGAGVDAAEKEGDPHNDESPYAAEAKRLRFEILARSTAFATAAAPGFFFCHVTAAVIWDLPVPLRLLRACLMPTLRHGVEVPPRGIDIGAIAPRRTSKAAGTRGHQFGERLASVRTRDGLRVSSPASTWAMLADELTVDELVEVGDAIVWIPRRRGMLRGEPADALATIEQLTAAANAPYRRHAVKLRAALALIRVGSSSAAETRIRLAGSRAGLPEPHLDYDVFAADGTPIGFTEFAHPEYRVLTEYEGDHHRTDRQQWQRDVDKHSACADAGWDVVRLTASLVYPSTKPAVARIRAALIRGGWLIGPEFMAQSVASAPPITTLSAMKSAVGTVRVGCTTAAAAQG